MSRTLDLCRADAGRSPVGEIDAHLDLLAAEHVRAAFAVRSAVAAQPSAASAEGAYAISAGPGPPGGHPVCRALVGAIGFAASAVALGIASTTCSSPS
jgi:hypothetical protein